MFNQLKNQQRSQQLAPIQNPPHQSQQNQEKIGGPRLGQQFGNMYQKVNEQDNDQYNQDRNVKLQMLQKKQADIKKNIANGQVKDIDIENVIELKGNEKIQDLNDDNLEYLIQLHLKQKPERKLNFLENLKDGTFVKISDAVLKEKEKQGGEDQDANKQEVVDQFSQDLYQLIRGSNLSIIKLLYFIQGLFFGYNIMYSIILFSGDTSYNREYQARNGLRLNQLLFIFGTISVVGSYHLYQQADLQVSRSARTQQNLSEQKSFKYKQLTATIIYGIIYIFIVIMHQFIAKMSDNALSIQAGIEEYDTQFSAYRVFVILIAVLSLFGWILQTSTVKSPIDYSNLYDNELEDFDDDSENDVEVF